jgi:hypothetical protein
VLVAGLIAGLMIFGLFLSMLTQGPPEVTVEVTRDDL